MEQSITSVVDGQVFDFRAPPIAYAANAREHVVSDDLIEYLPIEPRVLGRLHVDQHVINYKVCIGTSHEFGRGAERRIEDAALLRPEKARPDESEHALKIINQCFPGAFENTRIDDASAEDYIQVSKIDRRHDQISWWSALKNARTDYGAVSPARTALWPFCRLRRRKMRAGRREPLRLPNHSFLRPD